MTTRCPTPSGHLFRDPVVFWPVLIATVAVTGVSAVWSAPGWLSATIVVAVVAALGIPHGAVDHLVADHLRAEGLGDRHDSGASRQRDGGSRRRFLRNYVLAMAGVGVVWLVAPAVALVLFLALSVHHFGQSDLAYLDLPGSGQVLVQWSRGLLLVGLPIVAHVPTVAPVVGRLGGGDIERWTLLVDHGWLWCTVLVAQHVAIGATIATRLDDHRTVAREAATVAALTALLVVADPLIGFAVYFGLWHSLTHLHVVAQVVGTEPHPMRSVARLATPLTIVSLIGLVGIGIGAALAGRTDLFVPVVFVFVSMLTLPHMVVVERLWRRRDRPGAPAPPVPTSIQSGS